MAVMRSERRIVALHITPITDIIDIGVLAITLITDITSKNGHQNWNRGIAERR